MDKMIKTAGRLDKFFHILQIAFIVAAVAALVGLVLIGACFAFNLAPEQIGTGYEALDMGFLELELAADFVPDKNLILGIVAVELVMSIAAALLARRGIVYIRRLLKPMQEGMPFHEAAADNLKRLALLSLILGAVLNISEIANNLLTHHFYALDELLTGEKILRAAFQFDLDFSCLLISAVLLLLSYVFRYGQSLQQLSDETL